MKLPFAIIAGKCCDHIFAKIYSQSLRSSILHFHRKMKSWTMSNIPKWLSWILLFKLTQVYETCSIADALKTCERNPIIQRTFDHYFSAFLQSSNSREHYDDRNFILQMVLASFASLGAPDQSTKRYLTRLLLWSAVCNYARLRFRIFVSHKQKLCTSDRLENQYTWKWKKTKPDRKTYNELVNEQGLISVLDVTGRKKYIMALRQTCLFFFLSFLLWSSFQVSSWSWTIFVVV